MAFNIIAETTNLIDWKGFRDGIFTSKYEYLNIFPILTKEGIDSIGIAVPLARLDIYCWEELNILLFQLLSEYSFQVYELYNGEEILVDTIDNLKAIIGFKL